MLVRCLLQMLLLFPLAECLLDQGKFNVFDTGTKPLCVVKNNTIRNSFDRTFFSMKAVDSP